MRIEIRQDPGSSLPGEAPAVRVAALGDLMLSGEWEEPAKSDPARCFGPLAGSLAAADVVFANLETTVDSSGSQIPKQPRVVAEGSAIRGALTALGVDVVSLANNHAFDANAEGFETVVGLLRSQGIAFCGAGDDSSEASRPCVIERKGVRLGWLAYVPAETKPSHVAGTAPGVNLLHEERAAREVRELRRNVDHVLVSLHWGVEYCNLPSPAQRRFARRLVEEGASFVIGHHAHAVQGVEAYRGGVIAYNLGNATTTDFFIDGRLAIQQSRRTRSSFILRAALLPDRVLGVELVPFRAEGGSFRLHDPYAARLVRHACLQLAAGISEWRWRRRRLFEDVVLRTARKLDPRVIRSVTPRHVIRFFRNAARGAAGRGPE